MGFLKLLQREKKEHSLGVCIPEHERERIESQAVKAKSKAEKQAKANQVEDTAFEVQGYYEVRDLAMLSGRVLKGRITTKKKAVINSKEYKISEVQREQKKVPALREGERGAIFLNGKGLLVRTGKIIEVK